MTRPLLQPGILAPDFRLPAAAGGEVALADLRGRPLALIFFPGVADGELAGGLARFGERAAAFGEQNAALVGISDAPVERLAALASAAELAFPLLSDARPPRAVAARYGAVSAEGQVTPAVFMADADGLIRRVYDPQTYPDLPNAAMVVRALMKLAETPKPAPVTEADWRSGPAGAPVVLVAYSDYECRHCQQLHTVLHAVLPAFGGRVAMVHRNLPIRHSHPLAQGAAEAAEAAGAQGRFWEMHDRLFDAGGRLQREDLLAYAGELGLDLARFSAELDGRTHQEAVNESLKAAVRGKIKLPPTVFINGILWEGPHTAQALSARVAALLACAEG